MSGPIRIVLAGTPMGKQARATRRGISYLPKETKNYMASLRILAQEAMHGAPPLDGPVTLRILAVLPVPESWSRRKQAHALAGRIVPNVKPDWDNIGKQCDSFKEVIWRDDKQVYCATVMKVYGDRPRIEIEVAPWTGALSSQAAA
jgi:Holliday junction resolvase RusA-like endonuclease